MGTRTRLQMQTRKKVMLSLGGLFVLVAAAWYGYWLLQVSALRSSCGNDVLQDLASPDKKYLAAIIDRSCGATTPNYRLVSLRVVGTQLNGDAAENWVFKVKGTPNVVLEWRSPDQLSVISDATDESASPRSTWKNVTILREPPH
jgi:hypothetical protein